MLREYGLRATFYISPQNREFAQDDLLSLEEIKDIGSEFEIGAHTLTHRNLPMISPQEAQREIVGCKDMLEQITGSAVNTFCYPRGAYRALHVQLVKGAGYRYARTVRRYSFDMINPYEAGTSLHIHSHRSLFELRRTALFAKFRPIEAWRFLDWETLGRAMFEYVLQEGGLFHIWGHSWEIDRNNEWQRLEDLFRYISGHPSVTYAANGELESLP